MGKFGAVKKAPGAAKRGAKKVGRAGKAVASIRKKTTKTGPGAKVTRISMKKGGKKVSVAASKVTRKSNDFALGVLARPKTKTTARATKSMSTVKSTKKGKTPNGGVQAKQSRRSVRGGGGSLTLIKTSAKKGKVYGKSRKTIGKYEGETLNISSSKRGTRGLKGKSTTKTQVKTTGTNNTTNNVTLNTSRSFKPSIGGKKVKKTSVKNAFGGNDTTMNYQKRPISARNAAIGGTAGAGGYITYKRKTPSGKTITVRRKR
jgi:hypothetical protein